MNTTNQQLTEMDSQMSTVTLSVGHPVADERDERPMSKETHPNDYGPNYPDVRAERKAQRKERSYSWFDAWAFSLLIVCVAIIPTFWLLAACGRLAIAWVR